MEMSLWIMQNFFLPDTVKYVAIRINPKHDVLHGCIMDKRTFRVNKEHIGNPDFLHKTWIKGTTLIIAGGESQSIILPVVPQVQSHGEVLQKDIDGQAQQKK